MHINKNLRQIINSIKAFSVMVFMSTVFLIELNGLVWVADAIDINTKTHFVESFQLFGFILLITFISTIILASELIIVRIFYKKEFVKIVRILNI